MGENATEVIQLSDSEIEQIGESVPCASLGEERAEAANGDVSVGREEGLEVRFVAEFGEGGRRRRHGG